MRGVALTVDHKPDDAGERQRIEANGGSIQYLHHHNMKPFIRWAQWPWTRVDVCWCGLGVVWVCE